MKLCAKLHYKIEMLMRHDFLVDSFFLTNKGIYHRKIVYRIHGLVYWTQYYTHRNKNIILCDRSWEYEILVKQARFKFLSTSKYQ